MLCILSTTKVQIATDCSAETSQALVLCRCMLTHTHTRASNCEKPGYFHSKVYISMISLVRACCTVQILGVGVGGWEGVISTIIL